MVVAHAGAVWLHAHHDVSTRVTVGGGVAKPLAVRELGKSLDT